MSFKAFVASVLVGITFFVGTVACHKKIGLNSEIASLKADSNNLNLKIDAFRKGASETCKSKAENIDSNIEQISQDLSAIGDMFKKESKWVIAFRFVWDYVFRKGTSVDAVNFLKNIRIL